jgi:transposase-like protein
MANRVIPIATKVKVMQECLRLVDVEDVAARHGVSPRAIAYWFTDKVQPALAEVLVNAPPGPKPGASPPPRTAPPPDRPVACPACGGTQIWKNGTYRVLNWVWLLTLGWLIGLQRVLIQRWRCAACGHELAGTERQRQAAARRAWWQQVRRLIGLSRFKLGLSVRKTQTLIAFQYARQVSIGFIQRQTQQTGQRAQAVLARLGDCRQHGARFLLFDETFPKLGNRIYSLGVVICEHGLIRSVRTIRRKATDIPQQLRAVVGQHYQPQFFLTDLEVTYAAHRTRAGLTAQHLHDVVHLQRQIIRLFDEAVREVTVDVPKGLRYKARQQQRALKQRLLRKRMQPLRDVAIKAFRPGYESVCVLLLTGVVAELRNPHQVIQTASVVRLATRLERFIKKHGPAINTLLELAVTEGTPRTTNALESKNALLKPFSRIAKAFRLVTSQAFFAGVALMENFDIKTRGKHQGTSAIARAGIDVQDLGATDFFSAVGLEKPQIALDVLTG